MINISAFVDLKKDIIKIQIFLLKYPSLTRLKKQLQAQSITAPDTYSNVGFAEDTWRDIRERNWHGAVVVCGVDTGHAQFVVIVTCPELHSVHHH